MPLKTSCQRQETAQPLLKQRAHQPVDLAMNVSMVGARGSSAVTYSTVAVQRERWCVEVMESPSKVYVNWKKKAVKSPRLSRWTTKEYVSIMVATGGQVRQHKIN